MASEASRSYGAGGGGGAADSYIGSLISLTSKFEIRYEGVLYNINTEESSIGLRNVRSFGTEGRKKDGPQIPASDKIYEYILFRGSDIKDLQVKASAPVQGLQTAPIYNDPAIIQSHYVRPTSAATSLPTAGTGTAVELNSQSAQLGLPSSTFQGGLSLHQPGGSLGSWGSSHPLPAQNGSGLAMPFYWQGYYAPSGGLPHLQQPPLFHPPSGVPVPHSMQQPLQYPGTSAVLPSGTPKVPEFSSVLLQPGGSALNSTSTTLPSTIVSSQVSLLVPETTTLLPYNPPVTSFAPPILNDNLLPVPRLTSSSESVPSVSQSMPSAVSRKPGTVPVPTMAYQTVSQSMPYIVGSSSTSGSSSRRQTEASAPLVIPGQLLQPGLSTLASSQSLQTGVKPVDFQAKPHDTKIKPSLPESSVLAPSETRGPILPLPKTTNHRLNGPAVQTHHNNWDHGRGRGRGRENGLNGPAVQIHHSNWGRGRGRGRENGHPRPVNKFTEDFDFTAMNEKFNKDEVWGHLGKSQAHLRDREGEDYEADDALGGDEEDSSKIAIKPVYDKESFFDSLSSNTLDHGGRNGRTRFSEQVKIDTETFGEFQRHRLSRGGGRGFRGGRMHGTYYGRGYDYTGRGRGRGRGPTSASRGNY